MTTVQEERTLWSTLPGWGIVANLLPPEIIQARRVRVVRRMVVMITVVVVVLCVVGYGLAFWRSHGAEQKLNAEQAKTSQLQAEQRKYVAVSQIQGSIAQVQSQLAR
jgi:flagellar basal body-associated protein FliL